jgi:adenylate cyclase
MKTWLGRLYIPVIILIAVRILFQLYLFNNLEHKASDTMFRLRGNLPVSNDIIIVAIDDNTFADLNLSWPFPRELHARLIDNLVRAGADQIIFDIEFTEYSNPASDAALALAASRARNVIFAGKYVSYPHNPDQEQMLEPIQPLLAEGMNWGVVNMPTDWDGYVREYTLFETMRNLNYYSIGVAALANSRLYQQDWQTGVKSSGGKLYAAGYAIPIVSGNHALLNYFGPAHTFRHIPYSSVVDDSALTTAGIDLDSYYELLRSGVFRGKTVLVGATLEELHDKFPTPFSSSLTSGVEIHANFLEMVKQGNYLREPNPWLVILVQLLFAVILFTLLTWLKPQWSVLFTVGMIVLLALLAYLLFTGYNFLVPLMEFIFILVLLYIASLVIHYLTALKEKKFIRNAFQQFMAPELVNELLRNPANLKYGGSQQEISVLFSDIRSFTAYTEKHKPEETVLILKEYLTAMVDIIKKNCGIVDKFVGDEIMALYGTPIAYPDHALQACKTALEMKEELARLRLKWKEQGRDDFEIGIGINTGFAVVGNLGSEQIFDYTAIGDTGNLGARLEALNKEVFTDKKVIISESTYKKVKDCVEARFLQEVAIKGIDHPVRIYELLNVTN